MVRKVVTVHAAKTELSRLLVRVEAGEEFVIARGKHAVAKLVPLTEPRGGRRFGAMKGKSRTTDAFFEPLPASELAAWER
jgi:antitoxin (DNA-binding transcriptional repressor) of toxin-antitoxin stability system